MFVNSLRVSSGSELTWNPDIFLVDTNKDFLAADVQILEGGVPQYIPSIMQEAVHRMNSVPSSGKTMLFIPIGGILGTELIEKAVALNITIGSIDRLGVIHDILIPSLIKRVMNSSKTTKRKVRKHQKLGRIMSEALVKRAGNIRNLAYSKYLKRFALAYFAVPTPVSLNVQYGLAFHCIAGILKMYNLKDWSKHLDISKQLEKMARLKGEVRDHFLHQFQTFLIGAIILDDAMSHASIRKSLRLSNRCPRLDLPWLLTSIFHDYGYSLTHIDSCIDPGPFRFTVVSSENSRYSAILNSFYDCVKNKEDVDCWDENSHRFRNTDLQGVLFNAALERKVTYGPERKPPNHGIVSAHKIMDLAEKTRDQEPAIWPVAMSCALSAAVHDRDLWAELFAKNIFPIDALRFPLIYLLVLCDTLAEAGRPKTADTHHQDEVLLSFDVNNGSVEYKIWFAKPEGAYTMNYLANFLQQICFTNALLNSNVTCFT